MSFDLFAPLATDTDEATVLTGVVEFIDPDTLERIRMPVVNGAVSVARIGQFPPRTMDGNSEETDHEWLSGYTQNNWTGGGQLYKMRPSTQDRYYGIATLETRFPEQLSLLPLAETVAGLDGSVARLLGDYDDGAPIRLFAAYDEAVTEISGTDTFGSWTLAKPPRGAGTRFRVDNVEKLFIPMIGGWQEFTPQGVSDLVERFDPLSFLAFDNKLWAIDTDGVIWRSVTGAEDDWETVIQVKDGSRARHLGRFRNSSGDPAILVVTTTGALALDPSIPALYETDVIYPGMRDAALASARWRQEFWISYGIDLARYTLSTFTFEGMVRDDSVPQQWKGAIVSMAEAVNDLFLLINGRQESAFSETWWSVVEGELIWPPVEAPGLVIRRDGNGGFHTLWASETNGDLATNLVVSESGYDNYRLYWGWDGAVYTTRLSPYMLNPRQNDNARFRQTGELISSWINSNNDMVRQILAAIEVRVPTASATETITVSYQINDGADDDPADWTALETITSSGPINGTHRFRIGEVATMPNGAPLYAGEEYYRIRYKIAMERGADDTKSPFLESIALLYMPTMGLIKSFTFEVDCSDPENDGQAWGMTNEERRQWLEGAVGRRFVGFSYGHGTWFSVKVTGANGYDATGQDLRGNREVSLIEAYSTTATD